MSEATLTSRESTPPSGMPPTSLSAKERARHDRWTPPKVIAWILISAIAGLGWWMLAIHRGETVNGIWFVLAAVGSYFIGYRFYAKYIQDKLVHPDDERATPAEYDYNGRDFVPTDRRILYGHHFAAIAGAGPLVGPVLSAQMGYLPSTIWIIVGVILAGAVQDYLVLVISMRRGGRSLGQMAKDELGRVGGIAALVATLTIMLIIVAILAMVVVNSLAASSWGVWSVGLTIPIALLMGLYLRYLRPGKVLEVSVMGIILLVLAIASGAWIENTSIATALHLGRPFLAWAIIIYGFVASILPVWMLLAPRDYLSTFMKVGVITMLAISIVIVRPVISVPAMSVYAHTGTGPVFSGKLFPFLFVTIACGALSGFHATIASGTTPKLIEKESQARLIGYGGMLMESFVAIMALVAALCVDRGIYFAMNSPAGATGNTVQSAVNYVNSLGLTGVHTDADALTTTANLVGETSIISRTGGAPTLAVGLATIMHQLFGGQAMMSFWYHFAIMFEALFILTSVDAGTRVARFMLSDALGNFWPRLRNHSWKVGSWLTTAIMVAGWGSILLMGVNDPLGGINTLFPLFGIANQLLAAVALSICLVVFARAGHKWRLLIIFVPMLFTAVITVYGSWLKIFSPDPKIGYWANHMTYKRAIAAGKTSLGQAKDIDEMHTVVGNTAIQGTMSIIFVVCALIVMIAACIRTVQALRGHNIINTEDPAKPSHLFAPSGFIASKAEKDLQDEWDEFYETHPELDLEHVHKEHA
ncbi:Carbon starvation protein A [Cutibacterium granulosum]|uniref:Carbon starvation protein A n=1 Tax=Cutibacterium granulosum TaxID=33011 RepID=A0A239WIL2_9ACTN|nr:carbon starvation CstA family protein [Cutibacterium granulosum]KAG9059413.1 carbon starvation protein A [Cutibacterium granulosum DSM 20700]SNV33444.1 Carbon starvation protein A [Cutibacterium granulosum]